MAHFIDAHPARRPWPDYAAVWRWHFYAGLFCLPFVCWLAVTGSVYLFRPDIEAILDRPYESLVLAGPRPAPSQEARAALAAVPGAALVRYEPPATPAGAAQVVVQAPGGPPWRVVVDPRDLRPMRISRNDQRPMDVLSHMHGQLLLEDRGSMLVELAASWAVVMILTGLYLWWPRGAWRAAGTLYPRLDRGPRLFWRDLHAVTGFWVSLVTLFLLLSGLPWAASWGNYLTWARNLWSVTAGAPNWPVGATDQPLARRNRAPDAPRPRAAPMAGMPGMAEQAAAMAGPPDVSALDVVVPAALRLHPPRPVWITPPRSGAAAWTAASQVQNRPQRVSYRLEPQTGRVLGSDRFGREDTIDKVVNVAVAAHEGQLLGRINQAVLLLTALGLLGMSAAAIVLWWRRRPANELGAPAPAARPRFSAVLVTIVGLLALLLPLFAVSLAVLWTADRALLRSPAARNWLGLRLQAS